MVTESAKHARKVGWKLENLCVLIILWYICKASSQNPNPIPREYVVTCDTFGFFFVFALWSSHLPCGVTPKIPRFRIKFPELPLLVSPLVSFFVFLIVKNKIIIIITATRSKSSVQSSNAQKWPETRRHTRMVVIWQLIFPMANTHSPHTHTLFCTLCFCNFALSYHFASALYPNHDLATFTCYINHSSNYH